MHPNTFGGDTMVVILAFAMGARNATVRRIGVPDMTTTVLTMTLTGLAADSRLAGGPGTGTVRRTSAVVAMLTGAISGALLLKTSLALPLALAAVLVLAAGDRLRAAAAARGGVGCRLKSGSPRPRTTPGPARPSRRRTASRSRHRRWGCGGIRWRTASIPSLRNSALAVAPLITSAWTSPAMSTSPASSSVPGSLHAHE